MIASVLRLSREDCKVLEISDAYSVHRVVYSLFPKQGQETRDFLFADKGEDLLGRRILILSKREPVKLAHGVVETKVIPESFLNHTHYGFEVQLNPTKREKNSGKIVSIRGRESLLAWFNEKASGWGFSVEPGSLQVQAVGVQSFKKDDTLVVQGTATFMGRLTVVDRGAFIKSFTTGIGRAKGFGFGLFQIVPLQ